MPGALAQKLRPTPDDDLPSPTSLEQTSTEASILDILKSYKPELVPSEDVLPYDQITLLRELHYHFLSWYLTNPLPPPYVALDASRPWQIYWCVHAYALLGFVLPQPRVQDLVNTLQHCRPAGPEGSQKAGFGGGPGQILHLAPTYAGIMALAEVLQTREEWDAIIDRRAMHDWLVSLKQEDGSFVMHKDGEVDVRASYCALSVAALLGILTPELSSGAAQFIANCQTYEGGFSCASYPYADAQARPPQAECHGGYSFCALAAYFILCPPGSPSIGINTDRLGRWAAHMQAQPVEGGGFRGRTNKLVDGCYSWWNGGLFHFVEAYLRPEGGEALFDRVGLQEYALLAGQAKSGGMQDKPGKANDVYHTCYVLSGLSAAQHHQVYDAAQAQTQKTRGKVFSGRGETEDQARERLNKMYGTLTAWKEGEAVVVGQPANLINKTHPVFNVTWDAAIRTLKLFY